MLASSPHRTFAVVAAVVFPPALGLLATTCVQTLPAATATSASPAPVDASTPTWIVPEVPLARSRAVVLLSPPPAGPDAGAILPIVPDPPALVEQGQWVYDLRYDRADVFLVGVHRVSLLEPRATPRVMGRFALELYSGPTLIERVRFDFPGLGAADPSVAKDGGKQPLHGGVSLTAKLATRVGVMLPATQRGTKLELWDRATDRRWRLPWPASEVTSELIDAATDVP